jgi:hypothetical protein
MPQGLLNRTEVMNYLGCDSKLINQLIRKKKLTLYKIAGQYERFNKEEVVRFRLSGEVKPKKISDRGVGDRIIDFWQYNNFYIITVLLLATVIYFFFFFQS